MQSICIWYHTVIKKSMSLETYCLVKDSSCKVMSIIVNIFVKTDFVCIYVICFHEHRKFTWKDVHCTVNIFCSFWSEKVEWRKDGLDPWVRKIPWRRAWQPTLVFLPGKSHGQRSLVGYRPWGHKRLDMTAVT